MDREQPQIRRPVIDAGRLRREARRCYRLARGIAGPQLSAELEAIGRAFEREAELLETGPRSRSGRLDSPPRSLAAVEAVRDKP